MTARITYHEGNCTSKDAGDLRPGQMVGSTGGYYAPGDPTRLKKYGGRSAFGTVNASNPVNGMALCQFDSGGTDKLLALYSTVIRAATPGASGTFADLITGLSASTTRLSTTHYNNRWYLATGYDRNRVLESLIAATVSVSLTYVENGAGNSDTITRASGSFVTDGFVAGQQIVVSGTSLNDGTYTLLTVAALTLTLVLTDDLAAETVTSTITQGVRFHGMIPPVDQPTTVSSSATATIVRPTRSLDTGPISWQNRAFAYDNAAIIETYSRGTVGAVTGTSAVATWDTFGSAGDGGSGRTLNVVWSIAAGSSGIGGGGQGERTDVGTGGLADLGATVDIKIEYSTNWVIAGPSGSGTFTTLVNETGVSVASLARRVSQVPITVNGTFVAVRATITYTAGTNTVSMRIWDISVKNALQTAFSTTTGLYYAFTEYDAIHGALESAASPVSQIETMTSENIVTVTLPTKVNSNATHWRIYRTVDGGVVPQGLYLIGEIPIGQTTFVDDFFYPASGPPGQHFYALVRQVVDTGTVYFARDSQPPKFDFLTFYRGSAVGITHDKPRSLFYSFAGRPESFPEIYVHENFPFPERDVLVCAQPCGDSLIVAGRQLMMTMDDLPRVGNTGTFSAVNVRPLRGQPGCVNQDAMVSYSVNGEPRVAWVSQYGIHETNGTTSRKLSGDMAWPPTSTEAGLATATLFYDSNIQALIFAYASSAAGFNDRWAIFHMAPDQANSDGNPKWTGPSYGNFSAMAAGIVSNVYRRWSGFGGGTGKGIVYLENSGGTDASQSYSSTLLPFIVTTGTIYGDNEQDFAVYKANLRHVGFSGDTMTVLLTTGRDQTGATQPITKTPTLTGQKGTDVFFGVGGEWLQIVMTHTGANLGSILDWRFEPMGMGYSGRVA